MAALAEEHSLELRSQLALQRADYEGQVVEPRAPCCAPYRALQQGAVCTIPCSTAGGRVHHTVRYSRGRTRHAVRRCATCIDAGASRATCMDATCIDAGATVCDVKVHRCRCCYGSCPEDLQPRVPTGVYAAEC